MEQIVLHVDFDYFFAQCEELRNLELKTKPVAVCVFSDRGESTGAIATANYLARGFGVKSGMPIHLAKSKLRERSDAIFLPTDFEYYSEISSKAMKIIEQYGDIFEYVGKDEAYLDITKKATGDFNKASHLAQQLKNSIRDEVRLSCSIGISPNKLISKIASDYKKPDGLTVVTPEKVENFIEALKIRDIPGIGKKTEEAFSKMKIDTVSELKEIDIFTLNQEFGRKTAAFIHNAARGIDKTPVSPRQPSIQYSKIVTLKKDSSEYEFLLENLLELCIEVHNIIKKKNKLFKSVGVQFVQSDMSNKSKSKMLRNSTANLEILKKTAQQLLNNALIDQKITIRRLGLKVSELSDIEGQSDITNYF